MSAITLPPMEHTFNLKVEGNDSRKIWEGTFTYRRPNLRLKSEIAKMTARLNGDLSTLDEDMKFLHHVYATNRYTLSEAPEWFKNADYGQELHDVNVSTEIYKQGKKFENEWFEKVWSDKLDKKESKENE